MIVIKCETVHIKNKLTFWGIITWDIFQTPYVLQEEIKYN